METTLADLSPNELEEMITSAIDRRMRVWVTQVLDAIGSYDVEDQAEMDARFEASLNQSFQQANSGNLSLLSDFHNETTR
ncbi:protein of unknown function [Candidatus Promineifilum breve]|uniref:Uncharacterized protein n=1 Tax=Candidatus Promineifilum breve TaxID=1806508 RepID=A0A160T524_9CHLR|nr:hypothetical protein [Candidatus Promineifilum breve]CUS04892.2 protein of unknown function [Candidatus Promineifilum breve]